MLQMRLREFTRTVRKGFNTGFVSGMIVLFLILIGIPYNIKSVALFVLLLAAFVFGIRLARQLHESPSGYLLKNTLTMGVTSAGIVLLFMSLINRWQANGIDVRHYFDAITTDTMQVLTGVPAEQLHPHPPTDPITGEILQVSFTNPATGEVVNPDAPLKIPGDVLAALIEQIDPAKNQYTADVLAPTQLRYRLTAEPPSAEQTAVKVEDLNYSVILVDRTNPMRLTFDSNTGLHLKLGFDLNLGIGGFYGFLIVLIIATVLGTTITRVTSVTELGHYRKQAATAVGNNPLTHWVLLLLPLLLFALLWLSVRQGSHAPILSLGNSSQEIQLLTTFGIILTGMVGLRAAQSNDWNLGYPVRVGLCTGLVVVLLALGLYHIHQDRTYFLATSENPNGNQTLSIVALLAAGASVIAYGVLNLRTPGRLETQLVSSTALMTVLLMPLYLNQYQNQVLTIVGIYILLGLGLNVVIGYAGMLNLGYVAFLALGAYAYGFLTSNEQKFDDVGKPLGLKYAGNDAAVVRVAGWMVITIFVSLVVVGIGLRLWNNRRTARTQKIDPHPTLISLPPRPSTAITILLAGVAIATSLIVATVLDGSSLYHDIFGGVSPFLVGTLVGVLASALSGIVLCVPVLRLRGDYLAIVTLGFGEIIRMMFNNLKDYTGGAQGVLKIPNALPSEALGSVTYLNMTYLVFLGAALVAFFSIRLKQGRIGRAWNAVRSDEDIAQSMGIDLVQNKLLAFAIGAAFAGLGGALFAARQSNAIPTDFKLDVSISVLGLVIIGGMGSIPGVIIGAVTLIGIPEMLRELETYRILVFGALLVAMVIIRPAGLLPEPPARFRERARSLASQFRPQGQKEGEA